MRSLNHAIGRTSIPCKDHKAGFTVYHWTSEEDDTIHLFSIMATLAIIGVTLHHWNCADLSKLLIRFAYVIKVDEYTLDKSNLRAAWITVGYDKLSVIPKEFNVVFGK